MKRALGSLPFIVEDLGLITPDVVALREELGFPGMKVLQFAFDSGPLNAYLPHNYDRNTVVYTGTHDNQTTIGWFRTLPDGVRAEGAALPWPRWQRHRLGYDPRRALLRGGPFAGPAARRDATRR